MFGLMFSKNYKPTSLISINKLNKIPSICILVISFLFAATSDGSDLEGIDIEKGGACTRFNMRLELKVHPKNCTL